MLWYQGRETFRYPGVSTGKKKKTRQFNKWKKKQIENLPAMADGQPMMKNRRSEQAIITDDGFMMIACFIYLFLSFLLSTNEGSVSTNKLYTASTNWCRHFVWRITRSHNVADALWYCREIQVGSKRRERERERELCKKRSLCRGALPGADWTTTATGIRCWPVSKLRGPALRKRLLPVYMRWAAKRGDFGTRTLVFISNRYNVESCWKFFF